MGNILKIKPICLTKLNNAEESNFLSRYRKLVPDEEAPDRPGEINVLATGVNILGITESQLLAFDTDNALLTDLVSVSHISNETEAMRKADEWRCKLSTYFTTSVANIRLSPIAAEAEAAKNIYNIIKPYIGLYKLANQQKTQQIKGLLFDLSSDENKAYLATIHLTATIEELKKANDLYDELTNERTKNRAATTKEKTSEVRKRLDNLYEDMTAVAFATSVTSPTTETATFVNELNALISETISLYNQRKGIAKAYKKTNDRPEEI